MVSVITIKEMSKYKYIEVRISIFFQFLSWSNKYFENNCSHTLAVVCSVLFTFRNLELQITRNNSLFIVPYLKYMGEAWCLSTLLIASLCISKASAANIYCVYWKVKHLSRRKIDKTNKHLKYFSLIFDSSQNSNSKIYFCLIMSQKNYLNGTYNLEISSCWW